MATADKLTYLNATKLLLRDAIRRAGHYLSDAATFRSYPYALLPDESSLSLDFVRGEYVARNWRDGTASRAGLSNIMTTTRASGGGYFDHLGVYQWAANNAPRIDHDPATLSTSSSSVTLAAGAVTLAVTVTYTVGSYVRATHDGSNWMAGRVTASTGSSVTIWVDRVVGSGTFASWTVIRVRGLLVEESRTNLLTRSSDFANAAWSKANANVIVAGSEISPDGITIAYKCAANTANTEHYIEQLGAPLAPGAYSLSVFVRPGESSSVSLRAVHIGENIPTTDAMFSVVDGVFVAPAPSGRATAVTASPLGGGWYRLTLSYTITASVTSHRARLNPLGPGIFAGDGTSGIYIWGAQLEAGAFPTSYIPTTTAQVTRAADQCVVSNLADWYRGSAFSVATRFEIFGFAAANQGIASFNDGTMNNHNELRSWGPLRSLAVGRRVSGIDQPLIEVSSSIQQGVAATSAWSMTDVSGQLASNGALLGSTAYTAAPSGITTLRLGHRTAGLYLNGHIESLQFIPRALSNTELQRITA